MGQNVRQMGWTVALIAAGVYGLMGIVSAMQYALDKRASRKGTWRVSETRLLVVDLLGGWIGGLIARRVFRHKTRKGWFRVRFWGIVTLHVVGWGVVVWVWW